VGDIEEQTARAIWFNFAIDAVFQRNLLVVFVCLSNRPDIEHEWVSFVEVVFVSLFE
jgi:hypothetical protein